jgi:nucleotidyltransferase substrate binding protein (TIGR01987 family)
MSELKLRAAFANLARALDRLAETQEADPDDNDFLVDATIQRFEFCLELYWKTLRRTLLYEGIDAAPSPRGTLREAFRQGWLGEEAVWLAMLDDRNRTSHVYDEQAAQAIYDRVGDYLKEMRRTFGELRERYADLLDNYPPPSSPNPTSPPTT